MAAPLSANSEEGNSEEESDFYSLKAQYIQSWDHRELYSLKEIGFDRYRGKVVLIVNTGTEGPKNEIHFKQLVYWHNRINNLRKDSWNIEEPQIDEPPHTHLRVLGFPCNEFGNDFKNSYDEAIDIYVRHMHGTQFPMFTKCNCTGSDAHPVFQWIKEHSPQGMEPDGNFNKFVIDDHGKFVAGFREDVSIDEVMPTVTQLVLQKEIAAQYIADEEELEKLEKSLPTWEEKLEEQKKKTKELELAEHNIPEIETPESPAVRESKRMVDVWQSKIDETKYKIKMLPELAEMKREMTEMIKNNEELQKDLEEYKLRQYEKQRKRREEDFSYLEEDLLKEKEGRHDEL